MKVASIVSQFSVYVMFKRTILHQKSTRNDGYLHKDHQLAQKRGILKALAHKLLRNRGTECIKEACQVNGYSSAEMTITTSRNKRRKRQPINKRVLGLRGIAKPKDYYRPHKPFAYPLQH